MYSFPPGFRFVPTDEELIRHYLMKKIMNQPLPYPIIFRDLDIYYYSPKKLDDMFQRREEREMYFFTTRNRRYPNGSRPNRSAGNGFWKATGGDRRIPKDGPTIGYEKALVFYEEKPQQRPTKTTWIMHEYRLISKHNRNVINPSTATTSSHGASDGNMKMQLDGLVLCKIYNTVKEVQKNKSSNTSNTLDGRGGHIGHNSYPTLQLDHRFPQPVNNQLPPLINSCPDPLMILQLVDNQLPPLFNTASDYIDPCILVFNNAPWPSGFADHHPQAPNSFSTLQLDHQFPQPVENQLPPLINFPDPLQMTDISNASRPSGFADHHPQATDLHLFMFNANDDHNIIGGSDQNVCGMFSENMSTEDREYCPELPDDDFSFVEKIEGNEMLGIPGNDMQWYLSALHAASQRSSKN